MGEMAWWAFYLDVVQVFMLINNDILKFICKD
jgi:hypothetical protein